VLHESLLGLSAAGSPRHATSLLAEVERAADVAGGWSAVDLIAVGLGPGSFTGLRIGIATARGLASALGLPATGLCTLDVLAQGMSDSAPDDPASAVPLPSMAPQRNSGSLVVQDARRGELFAALYDEAGDRVWDPFVARPEALLERIETLAEPPRAAGSGAVRFRDDLAQYGVQVADDADPVHRVAARHICALAAAGGAAEAGPLEPIYLRPPDAERWRERDSVPRPE
jgi:tRNA threonylcarbamoyladenosine biosynthesis protein TsaB